MTDNYTEVPQTEEDELDIVELKNQDGKVMKFSHIGTIEYKEKWYAFFQPAEEIEGVDDEEVVIFEITGDDGDETLVPVEDEALLDEVFAEFVKELEADDDCECGCDCDCDDDDCHCEGECHCGHCDDDNKN